MRGRKRDRLGESGSGSPGLEEPPNGLRVAWRLLFVLPRSLQLSRAVLATLTVLVLAAPGTFALAALPPKDELERQKLVEEVRKLRGENDETLREKAIAFLPFVTVFGTVLLAVAGVVVPLIREAQERRAQRERELDQRKQEARRLFQEQLAGAIADLGSDKEAVRVSAAVSLENFLADDYAEFHDQVYRVLCANLGVDHGRLVNRFLVRAFAKAARMRIAEAEKTGESPTLDFARCDAERVDLSDLNLQDADFAFGRFKSANLTGCDLTRARGYQAHFEKARFSRSTLAEVRFHKALCKGAQFHDAVMTSAELRGADLRKAQLQRARLQGAHLDNAQLTGARFDQAKLADAYFKGADLDDRLLASLLNADGGSWRDAHFDPPVKQRLEEMAERRGRTKSSAGPPFGGTDTTPFDAASPAEPPS